MIWTILQCVSQDTILSFFVGGGVWCCVWVFCFVGFWDRISLCSSLRCPGTFSVVQVGLKLTEIHLPQPLASWVPDQRPAPLPSPLSHFATDALLHFQMPQLRTTTPDAMGWKYFSHLWQLIPVVLAPGRLKLEDYPKFQASLDSIKHSRQALATSWASVWDPISKENTVF